MILVDTSVWIDHLNSGDAHLKTVLDEGFALIHPFIIGEIALGSLRQRRVILEMLHDLPQVIVASDAEVLRLVDQQVLFGIGIGYVDAHLLTAVRLTADASLWTRNKRLRRAADQLGLAAEPPRR